MRSILLWSLMLASRIIALPASSQQNRHPRTAPSANRKANAPDIPDVVVQGFRLKGPFPVTVTLGQHEGASIAAGQSSEDAQMFRRCLSSRDAPNIRDAIDGLPHRWVSEVALGRVVGAHLACYRNLIPGKEDQFYGECNPVRGLCQNEFDRGAMIEYALDAYAPDADFTTAMIDNPAILGRYHRRIAFFNRLRTPRERLLTLIAGCAVGYHPDLALAVHRSKPNSAAEATYMRALIGLSPQCLGGAKTINLIPGAFRGFVAEAIYSWLASIRNVSSLVPDGPGDANRKPDGVAIFNVLAQPAVSTGTRGRSDQQD